MIRAASIILIASVAGFGGYVAYRGGNEFKVAYSVDGLPQVQELKESTDLHNQKPLANPPNIIKAIYATSWSAGSSTKLNALIKLIKDTELNAIVIDLKDFSGAVAYDSDVPEVDSYKAKEIRIQNVNSVIKKLHDAGIYAIGRITVFQDPKLAAARPDLAIKNSKTGKIWTDNKGLSWIDPASEDAWDYIVSIVRDAAARGFDELNLDYVRFASDGDLKLIDFPFYKTESSSKEETIRSFFRHLRNELDGIKISADLFGLSTINNDDLGIGQKIETAYENFDAVAPMVYPSHYGVGFLGHQSPAKYPYEVVRYSMDSAIKKLLVVSSKLSVVSSDNSASALRTTNYQLQTARLRPWLQDFDLLGVPYGATEVKAQISAVYDSFCLNPDSPAPQCKTANVDKIRAAFGGWMLWDPTNNYSKGALSS